MLRKVARIGVSRRWLGRASRPASSSPARGLPPPRQIDRHARHKTAGAPCSLDLPCVDRPTALSGRLAWLCAPAPGRPVHIVESEPVALPWRMPRDGSVVLSDLIGPTIVVGCEPCGRRGRYNVGRLMEKHGDL